MSGDYIEPGAIGYNPRAARQEGRFFGKYKATVKAIDDPNEAGRVRLYVPILFTGSEESENQWTDWARPNIPISGVTDAGGIAVPPVGSKVWATFEDGMPEFAVWEGGYFEENVPRIARGEIDTLEGTDRSQSGVSVPKSAAGSSVYPQNRMVKLPNGTIVELDETDGNRRVRVRHAGGSFLEMTHAGDIVKQAVGKFLLWAGSNIEVAAVSNFVVGVGGLVLLGSTAASNRVLIGAFGTLYNSHVHQQSTPLVAGANTLAPVSHPFVEGSHTSSNVRVDS